MWHRFRIHPSHGGPSRLVFREAFSVLVETTDWTNAAEWGYVLMGGIRMVASTVKDGGEMESEMSEHNEAAGNYHRKPLAMKLEESYRILWHVQFEWEEVTIDTRPSCCQSVLRSLQGVNTTVVGG